MFPREKNTKKQNNKQESKIPMKHEVKTEPAKTLKVHGNNDGDEYGSDSCKLDDRLDQRVNKHNPSIFVQIIQMPLRIGNKQVKTIDIGHH